MEEQGYKIDENVLYKDNKSAILLEKNGRKSAGKKSHALNVQYFFISDQVQSHALNVQYFFISDQANQGNLNVQYCPMDEMIGDLMIKPLQGSKSLKFQKAIFGYD